MYRVQCEVYPKPDFDFFVKPSVWNTHSFLLQMTSWKMLSFSVFGFFYIRGRRQCAAQAVWLSATLFLPLNPLSKGRCHCNVPLSTTSTALCVHQHNSVNESQRMCSMHTTTRTTPYHFPFYIGPALFCTALLDRIEQLNSNVLFSRSPLICPSLPHRENKTRILWTSF